jgi:hypothetical protein
MDQEEELVSFVEQEQAKTVDLYKSLKEVGPLKGYWQEI